VAEENQARAEELESIRATYAGYANSGRDRIWSSSNPGFRRLLEQRNGGLIELLQASVPRNGLVLDAGCGRGELAGLVHEQRPDISWTGVDLLEESIAAAQDSFPWARWVAGSADAIPLPDATYDAVVAEMLFSSLPTQALERGVARELERLLKPGGWLIWYDLRRNSPWNKAVHGINARDLQLLFPGWPTKLTPMTLAPPLARRLGGRGGRVYRALDAIPWLRSHLIGRLMRPLPTEEP
jgi:SAM-dependent methyltransferase